MDDRKPKWPSPETPVPLDEASIKRIEEQKAEGRESTKHLELDASLRELQRQHLHRQERPDYIRAFHRPIYRVLAAVFVVALLPVLWDIKHGGVSQIFVMESILGTAQRPYFFLILLAALAGLALALFKLRELRQIANERVVVADIRELALIEARLARIGLARKAVSLVACWVFTAFILSAGGWEPALTYMAGFRGTLILVLAAGSLVWLVVTFLASRLEI